MSYSCGHKPWMNIKCIECSPGAFQEASGQSLVQPWQSLVQPCMNCADLQQRLEDSLRELGACENTTLSKAVDRTISKLRADLHYAQLDRDTWRDLLGKVREALEVPAFENIITWAAGQRACAKRGSAETTTALDLLEDLCRVLERVPGEGLIDHAREVVKEAKRVPQLQMKILQLTEENARASASPSCDDLTRERATNQALEELLKARVEEVRTLQAGIAKRSNIVAHEKQKLTKKIAALEKKIAALEMAQKQQQGEK